MRKKSSVLRKLQEQEHGVGEGEGRVSVGRGVQCEFLFLGQKKCQIGSKHMVGTVGIKFQNLF